MSWYGVVRLMVGVTTLIMSAAIGSGALLLGPWGQEGTGDAVAAWGGVNSSGPGIRPGDARPTGIDNATLCDPRRGPRVQTSADPSGRLRITITAATSFSDLQITLRSLRIGPSRNAAIDIGPFIGRTDPFILDLVGTTQVSFTASRIVPDQAMQIALFVTDDCGGWPSFAGAGTGVAIAVVAATATTIPCVPGQACSSIPISIEIEGPSQFPAGARMQVTITSRADAVCSFRVKWPGRPVESLDDRPTDAAGRCVYDVFTPYGLPVGDGSFIGTVQDRSAYNSQTLPFTITASIPDNSQDPRRARLRTTGVSVADAENQESDNDE